MEKLEPTKLTWAALLAAWMDFARTSVALPDDHVGRAWRDSVASIIRLQAVTCAIGEIDRLARDEQLLALDKSELLIAQSCNELAAAWRGADTPPSILETQHDARLALDAATLIVRHADESNSAS